MQSAHNQFKENVKSRTGPPGSRGRIVGDHDQEPSTSRSRSYAPRSSSPCGLDHFLVHEITRIGMLEIYNNQRPTTDAFKRFSVTMDSVLLSLTVPASPQWLEDRNQETTRVDQFSACDDPVIPYLIVPPAPCFNRLKGLCRGFGNDIGWAVLSHDVYRLSVVRKTSRSRIASPSSRRSQFCLGIAPGATRLRSTENLRPSSSTMPSSSRDITRLVIESIAPGDLARVAAPGLHFPS